LPGDTVLDDVDAIARRLSRNAQCVVVVFPDRNPAAA
jgi:hypothetical protein